VRLVGAIYLVYLGVQMIRRRGDNRDIPTPGTGMCGRRACRLTMILGVQPARAGTLFDEGEVGGGTPLRFLWFPSVDPDMPEVRPEEPEPFLLPAPPGVRVGGGVSGVLGAPRG
jgi:hypothetical protein